MGEVSEKCEAVWGTRQNLRGSFQNMGWKDQRESDKMETKKLLELSRRRIKIWSIYQRI